MISISKIIWPLIIIAIGNLDFVQPDNDTKVLSRYLDIPAYVHSEDFKRVAHQTFMEQFSDEASQTSFDEELRWLGYCYDIEFDEDGQNLFPKDVKSGDKLRLAGKVFCLSWD